MALQSISLEGRRAYLTAPEKHWPEVLGALRRDVLPHFEPIPVLSNGTAFVLESWQECQAAVNRSELAMALKLWGDAFLISDDWIFDAALETLATNCPQLRRPQMRDEAWRWFFGSRESHPGFDPQLNKAYWFPPRGGWPESWKEFKHRMERQFRTQLLQYKHAVETRLGVDREKQILKLAVLAVRWQKGESISQIVQTIHIGQQADPEQATYRAIQRFSKSIGLKLRKRNQRPARSTVQPLP